MLDERVEAGAGGAARRTLTRLAGAAVRGMRALARALAHRQDVKRLAELDDRALKDIGLVRGDVAGALAEPFHKDPSTVLMVRRVERRARANMVEVTGGDAARPEARAARRPESLEV